MRLRLWHTLPQLLALSGIETYSGHVIQSVKMFIETKGYMSNDAQKAKKIYDRFGSILLHQAQVLTLIDACSFHAANVNLLSLSSGMFVCVCVNVCIDIPKMAHLFTWCRNKS